MKDYYRFSYTNYFLRNLPDLVTGIAVVYILLYFITANTNLPNGQGAIWIFNLAIILTILTFICMAYWRSQHMGLHWIGESGMRFTVRTFSFKRMRLEEHIYNVSDISGVRFRHGALLVTGRATVEIRKTSLFGGCCLGAIPSTETKTSVRVKRYYKTQHALTKRLYEVSRRTK